MPDTPKAPGPTSESFFSSWYFILVLGILIGLLIGWLLDEGSVDIHEGKPTFSKYNDTTGVITLPTDPSKQYWVTSHLDIAANRGLSIIPSAGPVYPAHHNCATGETNFWNLPGVNSYELTPLYDPASCTPTTSLPTAPIITGSGHTLVTKTGTLTILGPDGMPIVCTADVYTFTDASGNTSCITIVMVGR